MRETNSWCWQMETDVHARRLCSDLRLRGYGDVDAVIGEFVCLIAIPEDSANLDALTAIMSTYPEVLSGPARHRQP